jgi:competence protein ComEA
MLDGIDKGRLVTYAAVGLLVIAIALRLHAHGSSAAPAVAVALPARAAPAQSTTTSAPTPQLYVDVAGAVRHPGLYRVPAGSRVAAAVERAGGLSSRGEPTGVNLAAPLRDGQQVIVPVRGAAAAVQGGTDSSAGGTSPSAGEPISLSQASEAQLEGIDGIGPALAGRIIQYRQAHGGFHSLDELRQVSGIGDKRYAALVKVLRP